MRIWGMGSYEKDLRLKVLAATERRISSGDPERGGVVGIFGVSLATLKRWLRKRREVEDLSPGSSAGRKRRILATVEERWTLWACGAELEDNDETTLQGHCGLWEEQRGVIGVRRHDEPGNTPRAGLDLQKRSWVMLGATGRDEQARGAWREHLRSVDPERFWCSWTGARRTSPSSRATPGRPKAQRPKGLREGASGNWGRTVTLISSILLAGIGANRSVVDEHRGFGRRGVLLAFSLYLKEVLLWPTVKRGQIVVMDNLSVHKSTRVSDLAEQRGCEPWFLPAYSPDLNPIYKRPSPEKRLSPEPRGH